MYMCGRLRTASRPSRTLMLSAEYSALAAAPVAGSFSCAVSKIHLGSGCLKYHAKSVGIKAKRLGYLPEKAAVLRRIRGLYPARRNAVEEGVLGSAFRDQVRVRGGQDHLPRERPQVGHQEGVALRIQ